MNNQQFMLMMDNLFGTEPSRNILRMEPERTETLKSRIALHKGLVRIFIHPLYERWQGNGGSTHIENGLSRLLQMPPESTPPIIIFEEHAYKKSLELWLKYEGLDQNFNCYLVETEPDDSTPLGWDEDVRAYGWETVTKKFNELGIRRVIMGGTRLELVSKPDWTGKPPFMQQCVGIAFSHLSKMKAGIFDVKLDRKLLELTDSRSAPSRITA